MAIATLLSIAESFADPPLRTAALDPPPPETSTVIVPSSAPEPAALYSLEAMGGPRFALIEGDDVLGRVAITASRRWQNRWHTAVGIEIDQGAGLTFEQFAGEVGIWLHASNRIDMLLGWRTGYASMDFVFARINALELEPVAELAYHLTPKVDLRFAPAAVSIYRSGMWQVVAGPELGLAWWL